jgi:hypothetical protein
MASLVATTIGLLLLIAGASASTSPGCQGSASECPSNPVGAEEDGSLLQVRKLPVRQIPIEAFNSTAVAVAAGGCPNSFTWGIIQAAASSVFNSRIDEYLPFTASHTWSEQTFSYAGCSGTVTGFANISASVDLSLDELRCMSASCKSANWFGMCTEYDPMHISLVASARSLSVVAYANGSASWGAGCVNGSGSAHLRNARTSFTLEKAEVSGSGNVNLLVSPPTISSPEISSVNIDYDGLGDVECSCDGHPIPACVEASTYVSTPDFKKGLVDAIEGQLSQINQALADLLDSLGLSLEQLAAGKAEFHPTPEILEAMQLKRGRVPRPRLSSTV